MLGAWPTLLSHLLLLPTSIAYLHLYHKDNQAVSFIVLSALCPESLASILRLLLVTLQGPVPARPLATIWQLQHSSALTPDLLATAMTPHTPGVRFDDHVNMMEITHLEHVCHMLGCPQCVDSILLTTTGSVACSPCTVQYSAVQQCQWCRRATLYALSSISSTIYTTNNVATASLCSLWTMAHYNTLLQLSHSITWILFHLLRVTFTII